MIVADLPDDPYALLLRARAFTKGLASLLTTQCLDEVAELSGQGVLVPAPEVLHFAAARFSDVIVRQGDAAFLQSAPASRLVALLVAIVASWDGFTDSVDLDWSDAFQGYAQANSNLLQRLRTVACELRSSGYPLLLAARESSRKTLEHNEGPKP